MKKNTAVGFYLSLLLVACGGSDNSEPTSSANSSSSESVTSSSQVAISSSSANDTFELVVQESELGFCGVDGIADESKNDGYTGVGYVNSGNFLNASITWSVYSEVSERAILTFRFANGGDANRDGELLINDGSGGAFNLPLPVTDAWINWQTVSIEVDLVQGTNEILLSATSEAGLANIDYLKIDGPQVRAVECAAVSSSSQSQSSSVSNSNAPILPQDGNPVHSRYNKYRSEWSQDKADIILSHQYENGGWPKNQDYDAMGNGGNDLGTFDNGATTLEMTYLANVYRDRGGNQYRDAVRKAMDYIIEAQYGSGGWPQFYPLRGGYSDHVTFNDDAMSRILTVLHHVVQRTAPFDTDVITDSQRAQAKTAIAKGVDYILKAQWRQNGVLTVWCAQHGKDDYLPKKARAYELESLSGSESVEIIGFLMTQPQTPEIETAVKAALAWFRSPNTYLVDVAYDKSVEEKFVPRSGSRTWFRFYDLETNRGFFSDRDSRKVYDIMDISEERRNGYSWGGSYGEKIISYAESVGY